MVWLWLPDEADHSPGGVVRGSVVGSHTCIVEGPRFAQEWYGTRTIPVISWASHRCPADARS